jgi:aerobic carbon-monoxide dehydrogenase large subunit
LIAVGGVICNAIAAALRQLGVRPRDLPFSRPRLWRLIHEARASFSKQ